MREQHDNQRSEGAATVTAAAPTAKHAVPSYAHEGSDQRAEEEDEEKQAVMAKKRLTQVLQRPVNAQCADCNASQPKWATVTHGGVICTQCAGVHRSLGVHISFVLSCTLDKWTNAQVDTLDAGGNAALNATLEAAVPSDYVKPNAASARAERERFIRAKYEQKRFQRGASQGETSRNEMPATTATSATSSPASSSSSSSFRKQATQGGTSGDNSTTAVVAPSPRTTVLTSGAGMVEYVGVLMIELIEGIDLAGMDITGKSDPYVAFHLGEQSISSNKVHNDVNPHWRQTLMLSWDGTSSLLADVFDYNTITNDRCMGRAVVPADVLKTLLRNADDDSKPEKQEKASPETEVTSKEGGELVIDMMAQVMMPRIWATNFGEHMVAGAEGMTKGLYRGITGVWKDPIRGAKQSGLEGFAKGVGTGVAGVVYRPIRGLGTMVKETARSVGVSRRRSTVPGDDLVKAGSLHLKVKLQRF